MPSNLLAVAFGESSLPVYHVLFKFPDELLTVDEVQGSESLFEIVNEFPHVLMPMILQVIEVLIVKFPFMRLRVLIVDGALAIKGVILPLTLISDGGVRVEELAKAVHCPVLPLAVVDSAIGIREFAEPVTKLIVLLADVDRSVLIVLCDLVLS